MTTFDERERFGVRNTKCIDCFKEICHGVQIDDNCEIDLVDNGTFDGGEGSIDDRLSLVCLLDGLACLAHFTRP